MRGRINIEMLRALQGFPEPSDDTIIFYCGPSSFDKAVKEMLLANGYTQDMIFPWENHYEF